MNVDKTMPKTTHDWESVFFSVIKIVIFLGDGANGIVKNPH
jgi:hypothetical protein